MRILFLASRELSYQRLDVQLRAFRRFGSVQVVGYSNRASLILRSLQVSLKALPLLLTNRFDLVFVGFYGHLLMLPTGLLTRRPVLFDAFVSTYDTLSFDRGDFPPGSIPGRMSYRLDQLACRLADIVMLDTTHHLDYFQKTFNLSPGRLRSIPVGCNEDIFHPLPGYEKQGKFTVLYYCSYLPLHGADVVVQAANLMRNSPVSFKIIGSGPQYAAVRRLADELNPGNLEFVPYVPLGQLPLEIASAQVCLGGHFGVSEKAGRVIPGKVYQILAMAKPMIAADTPANRELLTSGETAWLCPQGNAPALAGAIEVLYHKPETRERLGVLGRQLYDAKCSEGFITGQLSHISSSLISS